MKRHRYVYLLTFQGETISQQIPCFYCSYSLPVPSSAMMPEPSVQGSVDVSFGTGPHNSAFLSGVVFCNGLHQKCYFKMQNSTPVFVGFK